LPDLFRCGCAHTDFSVVVNIFNVKRETKIQSEFQSEVYSLHNNPAVTPYPAEADRLHRFHASLCHFNARRLVPSHMHEWWVHDVTAEYEMRLQEGEFLETERKAVQSAIQQVPEDPDAFLNWFENLRMQGPGQNDALFPWLATDASMADMRWFLQQEAAGEAGFDDLVALTQIKLPVRAKLEMARNFWDEMGRGNARGMHGPMLSAVVKALDLKPTIANTVWQSLALANLMVGLAANRRYAYQAIGALGAIEMTAPGRVAHINAGLKRLGVPVHARKYFQLHATLDVRHSKTWNQEVIQPLVAADRRAARSIAEGALMRLSSGARCFQCYREHFSSFNFNKH
jgi:hypothetical protein